MSSPSGVAARAPLAAVSESPMAATTSTSTGRSLWTEVGLEAEGTEGGQFNEPEQRKILILLA